MIEKRKYALKALTTHLAAAGQRERLSQLLTDIRFLSNKLDLLQPQSLLDDYKLACAIDNIPRLSYLKSYQNFILKHAQQIATYPGILVSLIQREGFDQARDDLKRELKKKPWPQPWLEVESVKEHDGDSSKTRSYSLQALRYWTFDPPGAAAYFAADRQVVFYLRHLGEIGAVDLGIGRELQPSITCQKIRPLAIVSSADGQLLVVAYENGIADLLRGDYDSNRKPDNRLDWKWKTIAQFFYRLPQYEAPVMAFFRDTLWYQEPSGAIIRCGIVGSDMDSRDSVLETDSNTELSGIAVFANHIVLSLRHRGSTSLLLLSGERIITETQYTGKDVVCLCQNEQFFALILTSYELLILDPENQLAQSHRIVLEDLPSHIACGTDFMVWSRTNGQMSVWHLSNASPPQSLGYQEIRFSHPQHLVVLRNGEIGIAASSGAFIYNLEEGRSLTTRRIRTVFATESPTEYYAISELPDGLELTSGTNEIVHIAHTGVRIESDAIDGEGNLLINYATSQSCLINLRIGNNRKTVATPLGLTDIIGDTSHGFWLTDSRGGIYYVTTQGVISKNAQIGEKIQGHSQLQCLLGRLMWFGMVLHTTSLGVVGVYTMVLFEIHHGHVLRKLGQYYFPGDEGHFQTIAYDGCRDRLIFIWEGGNTYHQHALLGSIEDWLQGKPDIQPLQMVDRGIKDMRFSSDSNGVYVLCRSGNLFRLDAHTWSVQAVLTGTAPLTALMRSHNKSARIILVEAGLRLLACYYHEGGRS